jgi:hypothetical protein
MSTDEMPEFKYDMENYDRPEDRSVLVDVKEGKVVDKKDVPYLEIIRAMAKKVGVEIAEPRKGCHHCYGRGYVGIDSKTKAPIPCSCLFRNRKPEEKVKDSVVQQTYTGWNRASKRKMAKNIRKEKNRRGL